ncbi:MAG: ImmA/IrrE family metallo-endopeptidase [Bacteroidota bacterium]
MTSGELKASKKAIELLNRNKWYEPGSSDIKDLVFAEELSYLFKPINNCEGRIIFNYHSAVITINSNIESKEKIKFIFAHELGHFYNERELGNDNYAADRYVTYTSENEREREATAFAVELLMPFNLFYDICAGNSISKELLKRICDYFGVSLTTAVLRFASLAPYPVSVIMLKNNKVEWNFVNDYFRFTQVPKGRIKPDIEEDGLFYRHKNEYDLFGTSAYLNEKDCKNVNARDWYWHDSRSDYFDKLKQIEFKMPRYNAVLIVLWS